MTTPKSTITQSPATKRALAGTLPAKALSTPAVTEGECGYCGYSAAEGAVLRAVEDGVTILCRSCSKDSVLGACGHSRMCDCLAGYCN